MTTHGVTMHGEAMEPIMEIHNLVTQLYDPANQRNPTTINEIQTRIQQLQKGPNAWEIADALLQNPSTHHRFMGALTFIVKTNVTGNKIDEETTWAIVERLINHMIRLVNEGEQAMVIRKLANSLVTIFRNLNSTWEHAVLQLAASLAQGTYVSQDDCRGVDFLSVLLPRLNIPKATALLFFSVLLAEEGLRIDTEPQDSIRGVPERMINNFGPAFLLAQFILDNITDNDASILPTEIALAEEAMGSWKTWLGVLDNHRTHKVFPEIQKLAISCGQRIIDNLRRPSLTEATASVLTSALEDRVWAFDDLSHQNLEHVLSNSIVSERIIAYCGEESDTDGTAFIDLLVAYASVVTYELFKFPHTPQKSQILVMLQNVFKIPGYAGVEESASINALEWWSDIAERIPGYVEPEDEANDIIKAHLAELVLKLFNKLLYPTPSELAEWSDEEKSEFNAYRFQACDYLLAAYPILGVDLVNVFQESATNHLRNFDWRGFEVAMFCITQLSEAVDDNDHSDQCLNSIFGPEAMELCLSSNQGGITPKARQTLIETFAAYQGYFFRNSSLLPRVLNILFESLSFESSAQQASRSILILTSECSGMLSEELPVFLDQLDKFRTKPTATAYTMPRVLEGIATIIRRLKSVQQRVQTLERILEFFVQEANLAREEAAAKEYEIARAHGHLIMSCIAGLGKGLRYPYGQFIELDDEPEEDIPDPQSFWNSGPGASVQQLIMRAMTLLLVDFPVDGSIIEAACDIFKAGYTESSGVFVFPPSMTVEFIKSFPLGISGTDVIMATASSFLASHSSHIQLIRDEAKQLITHVCQLFASMLENPDLYDPETANAGVDFLARLMPRYYSILFSLNERLPTATGPESQENPIFIILLNFTVQALARTEPLVLRAASAFWVTLIDLQGNSPEETAVLDQVMYHFTPDLCKTLIGQIAGRCARSDLTYLSDVLRRLVFKRMRLARPNLGVALSCIDSQTLSAQDKSRFTQSLLVARGAKSPSLELVRSLWLKSRGVSVDYVC